MTDRQITHAPGCWGWGPKHYECAVAEIERLREELSKMRRGEPSDEEIDAIVSKHFKLPGNAWRAHVAIAEVLRAQPTASAEPVAWLYHDLDGRLPQPDDDLVGSVMFSLKRVDGYRNETPLYTTPPTSATVEAATIEQHLQTALIHSVEGNQSSCRTRIQLALEAIRAITSQPAQDARCKHGVRLPHECKECADDASHEDIAAFMAAIEQPAQPQAVEEAVKVEHSEGHCPERRKPGGCQLHNLQCGYPDCDRRALRNAGKEE